MSFSVSAQWQTWNCRKFIVSDWEEETWTHDTWTAECVKSESWGCEATGDCFTCVMTSSSSVLSCRSIQRWRSLAELSPRWVHLPTPVSCVCVCVRLVIWWTRAALTSLIWRMIVCLQKCSQLQTLTVVQATKTSVMSFELSPDCRETKDDGQLYNIYGKKLWCAEEAVSLFQCDSVAVLRLCKDKLNKLTSRWNIPQ